MLKQTNIKFKRRLTVAALLAVAVTAIVPFATSSAANGTNWGPSRKTYTMKNPADEPTFNSITDNNVVGNETNFVRVGEVGSGKAVADTVKVTPGKEYQVWIFYHNDAKSSLNQSGKGIARGVRVTTGLTSWTVSSKKSSKVSAVISATNTNPLEVWDEAIFTTDSTKDVVLKYVEGSAKIYNQGSLNGTVIPESLFSKDGAYIGHNKFSGIIPGCEEYSGHIIYRIRAEQVGAKVTKTVSKDGKNFYKTVDAKPGDTLTYKVKFENTGTTDLTNVTFHDKLPSGVTLVNGTTKLVNSANPNGLTMKDIIGQKGFNTGLYGKGSTATLTYKVKVNSNAVASAKCNSKTAFKNTIYVDHNAGEINDSSTIYVTRECKEDPKCDPTKEKCDEDDTCDPTKEKCDEDDTCDPTKEKCDEDDTCDSTKEKCDEDDCDPNDVECICTKDPKNSICDEPEIPKTGPGEIALAIVAVVCIATGGIYWYRSQKDLVAIEKGLTKDKK